jgi:glycosyltransferase involved in cell wall biosynthesis
VHPVTVAGAWPAPAAPDRARLGAALAAVPDGDVVLLDGLVAGGSPEILLPETDRLRLAVLVHLPLGDETGPAPHEAARREQAEGQVLRGVAGVVATSDAVARRLVDRHGLDARRVHVARPGVDAAAVTAATEAGSRLVCVASVTPRKGHLLLLEALATLRELDWTLVCAGPLDRDPAHTDAVRRAAADAGIGDRVDLAGPLAGERLEALWRRCDLHVLASHREPYGMVVTEALARGVPVVASAVDGVPEALGRTPDGVPGIAVPPDDVPALAAALRGWLTDPALRRRLRTAALARRATLRGWDETVAALAAALDRVAAGEPSDHRLSTDDHRMTPPMRSTR